MSCQRQKKKRELVLSIWSQSAYFFLLLSLIFPLCMWYSLLNLLINLYSSKIQIRYLLLWEDMPTTRLPQATLYTSAMLPSVLCAALSWPCPCCNSTSLFYVQDCELLAEGFRSCLSRHPRYLTHNRNLINVKRRTGKKGQGTGIQWWWVRNLYICFSLSP